MTTNEPITLDIPTGAQAEIARLKFRMSAAWDTIALLRNEGIADLDHLASIAMALNLNPSPLHLAAFMASCPDVDAAAKEIVASLPDLADVDEEVR